MKNRIARSAPLGSRPGQAASLVMLIALVVGCSSGEESGTGPAPSIPSGASATPSVGPVDPQPTPEPGETRGTAGGPAFEPTSTGAPVVVRGEGPASRAATVAPVTFTEKASWSDGLEAGTQGFTRGTISATGVGIITGASYVTIEVQLRNRSETAVVLESVVPTLLIDGVPAAPTYDIEHVADLSGSLAPGATASGTYGFHVDPDSTEGTFYLDVDGNHAVATFTGTFT